MVKKKSKSELTFPCTQIPQLSEAAPSYFKTHESSIMIKHCINSANRSMIFPVKFSFSRYIKSLSQNLSTTRVYIYGKFKKSSTFPQRFKFPWLFLGNLDFQVFQSRLEPIFFNTVLTQPLLHEFLWLWSRTYDNDNDKINLQKI